MKQRWWVDETHARALPLELDVAAWMQPAPDRHLLSSDRQSAALRFDGPPPLLVKWRRPLPGKARSTFLRASRERREARTALRCCAAGIPTPRPLAVGELRARGLLLGAVLVRGYRIDAETGREAAERDPQVIERCAQAIGRWHRIGFRHGDCYLKNLLLVGDEAEVQPIGYPKGAFMRAPGAWDKARCKDLAQLAAGCTELSTPAPPFDWLPAYLEGAEETLPAAEANARILPAFERVMARKRERIATRASREPDGPPAPLPLPLDYATGTPVDQRPLDTP